MDIKTLIGPALVAAIVSGIVAIVGAVLNRKTLLQMHGENLAADAALHKSKVDADRALTEAKFKYDRELAVWKRKTEIAEEVLADAYKASAIFDAARQPFSLVGEGASRLNRGVGETEAETSYRDAVYTPYERLVKERDFFTSMHSKHYRFMAYFGNQAGEPFLVFLRCYNEIRHATEALLSPGVNGYSQQLRAKYEERIGWGTGDEDRMKNRLNEAVTALEGICRPIVSNMPE
ncbi:hypothetical protein [Brucella anthropi]|uniref:hypothetical protein n=1 Tax=Brucella anthropi TaxID=529 RepID=UPI0024498605|nr:hypothetical protein [Brucella anthropi]MDG9790509.1 hypothetical protein [Brucella anthropi]MDH0580692.1 hypothetical protein [Brucella anthropi]MDH0817316.1 hypothetical protein [Brucella anthropi]MDH2084128.1 hypothetical protein [Brucella anthropi]